MWRYLSSDRGKPLYQFRKTKEILSKGHAATTACGVVKVFQTKLCILGVLAALVLSACSSTSPEFRAGLKAFEAEDYAAALKQWQPVANKKDADAQHSIGWMYENGLGVEKDMKAAADWYQKALDNGHKGAGLNLGNMYDDGDGVPQDYKKAAELFEIATGAGFAEAYNNLGHMYRNGQGVEKDEEKAAELLLAAASAGYAPAQNTVGVMFFKGQGLEQSAEAAYYWFTKAVQAEQPGA
jgi:TPR repeat protein